MESLVRHPEVGVLLERFETEPHHVTHVARLARQLSELPLLESALDSEEQHLLEIASLLHDIGWAVVPIDGKGHHKESARLIREYSWTTLPLAEVEWVALTARYHRKAIPSEEHEAYSALTEPDRLRVRRMAALLRVADALDRRHIQRVDRVSVERVTDELIVRVHSTDEVGAELLAADKKADLLREVVCLPIRFVGANG
jgi:exopolyphosphatase/guanosine-5'-triphosphate,3'-diphosphate pyrophosphatase